MKAALFETVGRPLRVDTIGDPSPAPDEVLLKVAACGICGSDLHMTADPETFGIGQGVVLGHEFAGEVVASGSDVTGLTTGDRVAVAPLWGCGHCDSCLHRIKGFKEAGVKDPTPYVLPDNASA